MEAGLEIKVKIKDAQGLWLELQKFCVNKTDTLTFDGVLVKYGRHTGKFVIDLIREKYIYVKYRGEIIINEEKRGSEFKTSKLGRD